MSDEAGTQTASDAQAAEDQVDTPLAGNDGAQDGAADEPTSLSPEDARKLRSEARSLRQRLKAAEDKVAERESADLNSQQKLERELSTEKANREQLETDVRNLRVQVAAGTLGVRAEAVARIGALIDWEEVEDASDGKQVEKAIRTLLKEMPFLSARPDGLDGGNGREGRVHPGEGDMNSTLRRLAGRA